MPVETLMLLLLMMSLQKNKTKQNKRPQSNWKVGPSRLFGRVSTVFFLLRMTPYTVRLAATFGFNQRSGCQDSITDR